MNWLIYHDGTYEKEKVGRERCSVDFRRAFRVISNSNQVEIENQETDNEVEEKRQETENTFRSKRIRLTGTRLQQVTNTKSPMISMPVMSDQDPTTSIMTTKVLETLMLQIESMKKDNEEMHSDIRDLKEAINNVMSVLTDMQNTAVNSSMDNEIRMVCYIRYLSQLWFKL